MAHGYPDFLGWAGRSGVGSGVVNYSFTFAVGAGATVGFALPVPPAGFAYVYQYVCVSTADDTAIHLVYLDRVADAWIFFVSQFITAAEFNFPGQSFPFGMAARLFVTNNAAGALTFVGTVGYTIRPI